MVKHAHQSFTTTIVTPTTKSRTAFIKVCLKCILHQTYLPIIHEWVIVSADKSWKEDAFYELIASLQAELQATAPHVSVVGKYVTDARVKSEGWPESDNYEAVGYLRNITNLLATGDFIVCMDDDDYYPPKRVEHAVTELANSTKEVAGCTKLITYETDLKYVYQWKGFGKNHSTNTALAYKKSYLLKGFTYDSKRTIAEERSFLDGQKTPMVQLSPEKTVVHMVHHANAGNANKYRRTLVLSATADDQDKAKMYKISSKPSAYIPRPFLDAYHTALYPQEEQTETPYDIVYYLGHRTPRWSPYDAGLRRDVQAVKHLVESWVGMGYSVCVFGHFTEGVVEQTKDDPSTADYRCYTEFKCAVAYKVLILWCKNGVHPLLSWPVRASKLYIDLHDNEPLPDDLDDHLHRVDSILVRSAFHKNMVCDPFNADTARKVAEKTRIIPSGVCVDAFSAPAQKYERDLYRFCWSSCYTRGLMHILQWVWPIIKRNEPRAEFHIYHGLQSVQNIHFKNKMRPLLQQPGVCDHGRQSVEMVIREKHRSTFHLYFSKTADEMDGVSLRESVCAGCIPIVSNYNVFAECQGLHLPGDPAVEQDMVDVGAAISEMLRQPDKVQQWRDNMVSDASSWTAVASQWPMIE